MARMGAERKSPIREEGVQGRYVRGKTVLMVKRQSKKRRQVEGLGTDNCKAEKKSSSGPKTARKIARGRREKPAAVNREKKGEVNRERKSNPQESKRAKPETNEKTVGQSFTCRSPCWGKSSYRSKGASLESWRTCALNEGFH